MASINGISLKSLKHFKDHEGMTIAQGNVYYNGKKLGFWSQDSWGGGDRYDFDTKDLDTEAKKYAKSSHVKSEYKNIFNLDCLMYDLICLMDTEKSYKKGIKNGYRSYVEVTDGYHVFGYWSQVPNPTGLAKAEHKKFMDSIKDKLLKDKKPVVNVYNSDSDFVIAV